MAKATVKASKHARSESRWAYLMVAPTVIGLLVLNIYPFLDTIKLSFSKTLPFGMYELQGLNNYIEMFTSPEFWRANLNTLYFCVLTVPLGLFLSLVVAVMLNARIKGQTAFRAIFFLPMVAAPAAVAMVWRWLFNSEFGLLNNLFGTEINWISDPKIAVFSIAVIGIWSIIGYNMVLFLSGLQEIPRDYYEASSIDGANGIYQFFHITVPLLSPTIFFVTVTRVISALQVFDLIFMVMDKNNPALSKTQSLVYLFYDYSFINNNRGLGSSIVVLLLVIIMIITVFQMYAQKKWVYYN